ncbi:MAG: A/G-specific adenine glycosylase [Pseudomonadota bacterium]
MQRLASRLLAWYDRYGRHDLPWQQTPRSAYRVWLAEIMLQQTSVSTVIPYYHRFLERFPALSALANADRDEVLALWTGLGYYARARNLHAAAQHIRDAHGGRFPTEFDEVVALPGIGRSTAGAILAQAYDQCHAILDGNVKRVLTRLHAIPEWPGKAATQRRLWRLAEEMTPAERVADYTQAIMDLGATCCHRRQPDCAACPLRDDCLARSRGVTDRIPAPRPQPTRARRSRSVGLVLVHDGNGHLLLEQRPPNGVWGGLWSFPEVDNPEAGDAELQDAIADRTGVAVRFHARLAPFTHVLSHFDMVITPLLAIREKPVPECMDGPGWFWYKTGSEMNFGVAAPVRDLLDRLAAHHEEAKWRTWFTA